MTDDVTQPPQRSSAEMSGFAPPQRTSAETSGMPTPTALTLSRKKPLIAFAIFAVIVAVLAVFLLKHNHTAKPVYSAKSAVSVLLKAGETNNLTEAKKAMCSQDLTDAKTLFQKLQADGEVTAYTINAASTHSGAGAVEVTVTAGGHAPQAIPFPVVGVGKGWQVCISKLGLPVTFAGVTPSASTPLCAAVPAVPSVVASTYVYAAATGQTAAAQGCVYHQTVARSVTASLAGKPITITDAELAGDGPYTYKFAGKVVVVSVTQEADGHDYVTGVTIA